jgi:hypothetical protein
LNYLQNPQSSLKRRQDKKKADLMTLARIELARKYLPEELKPYARRFSETLIPSEPTSSIDRRFPIPHDPGLLLLLQDAWKKVAYYKNVNNQLMDLIRRYENQRM